MIICRQLRITAANEDDAAKHMLDKWPGWTVKIKRSPVPVINGANWWEVVLINDSENGK